MKKILLLTIFSLSILAAPAIDTGGSLWQQNQTQAVASDQNELRVYPNPTQAGRVTLEMNSGEIAEVRLINIAGKEVVFRKLDFGAQKYILPLDNIPDGIYFVRVQSVENKTVVKKLIVASR